MAHPKLLAHPQTSTATEPPRRKIINEAFSSNAKNSSSAFTSTTRSSYRPPTTTKSLPPPPPSGGALTSSSLAKAKKKTPQVTFAAIDQLRKGLSEIPYLITLQPGCPPFPGKGRYEDHRGSPFETWEYERYQYMSFIPCEGLKEGAVLEDRELLNSLGDWREASRREERKYYKWREDEERRREVEGKVREMESGRSTPWGTQPKVVPQTGSGGNTTERKKVNFADYLKKKKTSPRDTPARPANSAVPQVKVNDIAAAPSDSIKSTEPPKDSSTQNSSSTKPDLRAKPVTNGNSVPHKPQTAQAKPSAPEKEEGELADEPSLPSSIANVLKAPIGREPVVRQPSVPTRVSPEKPSNKRPAEKSADVEKRQKIENKVEAKPEPPKQPYAGSARPAGHQRAPSGGFFDRLTGRSSREFSKTSTPLPPKRDEDRRKSIDRGAPGKNGMPRLLSPLPSMQSTPMQKSDSQQSRREDRSPPRSQPMRKGNSRDSERSRDRSPPRSQPMRKENSRDSHKGDDRRRSRSPIRSEPMKKDTSRNSTRDRSPRTDERRRSRSPRRDKSPQRSQPMKKETSRDARRDLSPVKKDIPVASKPKLGIFGDKTTSSSTAKKEPAKEPKKEPLLMPAMLSFDLPSIVQDDMKRRLDAGELAADVAAAFTKVTGQTRHTSNISDASQVTAITNGSSKREREETPVTESERAPKKTSTQAARERARKGDTPGVARKAVASKSKAKVESKIVKLCFDEDSPISDKIAMILKTTPERNHVLSDYQSHRGKNMIKRRIDAVRTKKKEAESSFSNKCQRPFDDHEEDEDQSPVQRKRQQPSQRPSTPCDRDRDSGLGAESLAPPSISKLKQEPTPDKAGTPGAAAANTPTQAPVSPTAVRSAPSTHALTDAQKAEVKKLRAEYDRYISLGTSLKRQRDALIRPSPDSQGAKSASEVDAKKANIIGVESLLAYLVGFETMDRAYKIEGTRNRGQHWKSLFPYLDSFRLGLKSSSSKASSSSPQGLEAEEKMRVILDIVATLVGYSGASCLATLHNNLLEKDGPPNSREAMQEFIKEQTGNFKRREFMGQTYQVKCQKVAKRWPEMVDGDKALAWIRTPGGQFGAVGEVRGKLSKIVKELCSTSRVDWQGNLDF